MELFLLAEADAPLLQGVIFWVGIGIIAGLLARLILPGPDPMNFWCTILLGMAGAFLGGMVIYIYRIQKEAELDTVLVPPENTEMPYLALLLKDPLPLISAVVGAILILAVVRIFRRQKD